MDNPFDVIAAERHALAELIDSLTPEQLATTSLCGEWTAQDVAAHLTVGPTASLREFVVAMARSFGDFDKANDRMTKARRRYSAAEVAGLLRDNAGSRFTPPSFDWHAPLTDLRIHRLDITIPLGFAVPIADETWREVLGFLTTAKALRAFVPKPLPPVRFQADDLDWAWGAGAVATGPAAALAGVIAGRRALLAELDGPGREILVAWLAS